jgi:STE24 endopeptidase
VPEVFKGMIDENLLKKTRDYTLEHMKFGAVSSIFEDCLLLIFIFGLLNFYNSWILSFKLPFILEGLVFFIILVIIKTVINIPFDLYDSFKIENRYGFNNMTLKLWISDFIKGILIAAVIMSLILGAALYLVQSFPDMWWFAVWLFLFIFSIFMMYISPYVLEPLFNKFTNIDDPEFESSIKELSEKAGIHVTRVFKMDASKRTNHSNAYFSGIGKTKRIVIYDTLLANLTKSEILAVLAHEAGHWKKKHILKHIITFEILSLIGIYLAFLVLKSNY